MSDNIPTQINLQILKPFFCEYLGGFAIRGSVAETTHLPHGFTPPNTCPTKNSNDKCLGYDAFVIYIFTLIGNHLYIGVNKNHVYDMMFLKCGVEKCQDLFCGPVSL